METDKYPNRKMGKNVKRQFTKEIQMVNKWMQKYSIKLVFKEIHISKGMIFFSYPFFQD